MKTTLIHAAAGLALALGASGAWAAPQDKMSDDHGSMASGAKPAMSAKDKKQMAKCQGMSHDAMMKDKKCSAMMKSHPDMMKNG